MFMNGQQVVDHFESLLASCSEGAQVQQPVSLLILDFKMPILDGVQTLVKVKEMFDKQNSHEDPAKPEVIRPAICILSQYQQTIVRQYTEAEEQAEIYFEKPLPEQELVSLTKILNLV